MDSYKIGSYVNAADVTYLAYTLALIIPEASSFEPLEGHDSDKLPSNYFFL